MTFETAGYSLLPVLPEIVLAVGAMALLMVGATIGLSSCIVPVPVGGGYNRGPGYHRGGPVYRGGHGYRGGPRHYPGPPRHPRYDGPRRYR